MIQILPLADIIHEEVLLEDDFNNKFEGWELIEDEDEHSFIGKSSEKDPLPPFYIDPLK